MRGGGCGAGSAWSPRRGERGLRGRGEWPLPPPPPLGSSAAGSGSARIAHQHSHSSATIGILRTTAIQMKPHVIGAMVPGVGVTMRRVSDVGLFGPQSVTWRVNREGVLLLGGGAAIIMQVAHPLVGAGVAEHSNYREDPWGRLYRTLDITTSVVFGSTEKAHDASERLRGVHRRVHGLTREPGGRYPAGTKYSANDPKLGMWVHATLINTALQVYTAYVGPLSQAEKLRYYEEQLLLGEMFGVPRDRQPQTLAEFHEYFDHMVETELAVTDALLDVVDATMRPELPFVARPLVEGLNLATVSLLPPRLRDELGLDWGPNRRRLTHASRAVIRRALPVLPRLLREFPPARSADRRAATAA